MQIRDLAIKASAEECDKGKSETYVVLKTRFLTQNAISIRICPGMMYLCTIPLYEPDSDHQYLVTFTESTSILPGAEQVNTNPTTSALLTAWNFAAAVRHTLVAELRVSTATLPWGYCMVKEHILPVPADAKS